MKLQTAWDGGKWLDDVAGKRGAQNRAFEAKVEGGSNFSRSFVFRPTGPSGPRQWERYRWLAFAKKDKDLLIALKPNVGQSFANLEDAESVWNMLGEFQYVVTPSLVRSGWMMKPKASAQDSFLVEAKLNGGTPVAISVGGAFSTTDVAATRWFLESGVEEHMAFQGAPFRNAALEAMKSQKETSYFIAIARDNRGNGVSLAGEDGAMARGAHPLASP